MATLENSVNGTSTRALWERIYGNFMRMRTNDASFFTDLFCSLVTDIENFEAAFVMKRDFISIFQSIQCQLGDHNVTASHLSTIWR